MISFRDREDTGPAIVAVLSIVVLIVGFLFMTFAKPPTSVDADKLAGKKTQDLKTSIKASTLQAAKSQAPVDKLTWQGDAEYIMKSALDTANKLALSRGVKLNVFRPQRAALVDNLVCLPYVITVEGTFLNTLGFARDLEAASTKVAVTQIQISSSDPNTDKVTANVGVAAYVNPKEEIPVEAGSTLQSRLDHRTPPETSPKAPATVEKSNA